MSLAIQITGLYRRFGAVQAVDGLDLVVPAGQIYGLIGPDGAGKTTTLRMLCGALLPDSGQVLVHGIDVTRQPEQVRQQIGYMPQRFSLYGDLTVGENLAFFADAYSVPHAQRPALMERLLGFSRLTPFRDRRADALSGGMKQKLALACTLIHRPSLLLLDEPTTGVDPVSRREFWEILREAVRQDHVTVLVSTPYMDEADRCHTVGFVRAGKVLAYGSPRDLQQLLPGVVLELTVSQQRVAVNALRTLPGVRDVQLFGDRLHLLADQPPESALIEQALALVGSQLLALRPVAPAMEDVFMFLQSQQVTLASA